MFGLKKRIGSFLVFCVYLLMPVFVNAQLKTFASRVIDVLNAIAGFITGLAVLFFVFGMIRFIANAGDEKGREEGKQMMVWGTLSIFMMVTVWGLVAIIQKTFLT